MKVYYSLEEVPPIKNPVLTLGTYDGVHIGHQKIIDFLNKSATRINGETVLFTFHPHPRMVLYPKDHNLELIQNVERRIERLEEAGIDHLILFPFTKEFSRMGATEFVRNILVNQLNVKLLTIGYDHHFGRNREGNIQLLKELAPIYNFEVEEIPAFQLEEVNVSSTKIRRAIQSGDMETANSYLGRPFRFTGTIIEGDKIGNTIGFPTANIGLIEETQIIPKLGAYTVKARLNKKVYDGMMNIGFRPTVSNEKSEKRIEVNLFDFDETVYGLKIEVFVLKRIREEHSFGSIHELKSQLEKDALESRNYLSRNSISI